MHRFKERVDIFEASGRNFLLQFSLTYSQRVVVADKHIFLVCALEDGDPIGYFTFFAQDDDIVNKNDVF